MFALVLSLCSLSLASLLFSRSALVLSLPTRSLVSLSLSCFALVLSFRFRSLISLVFSRFTPAALFRSRFLLSLSLSSLSLSLRALSLSLSPSAPLSLCFLCSYGSLRSRLPSSFSVLSSVSGVSRLLSLFVRSRSVALLS